MLHFDERMQFTLLYWQPASLAILFKCYITLAKSFWSQQRVTPLCNFHLVRLSLRHTQQHPPQKTTKIAALPCLCTYTIPPPHSFPHPKCRSLYQHVKVGFGWSSKAEHRHQIHHFRARAWPICWHDSGNIHQVGSCRLFQWILARWQQSLVYSIALNLLRQAICTELHRCIAMAVKKASKGGVFYCIVDFLVNHNCRY